ncbi:hypothetical protein PFISCL1PPCAC_5167, partial [Pristionchus fissidentatus]
YPHLPRQSEIDNVHHSRLFRLSRMPEHEVRSLDIAMHESRIMHHLDRVKALNGHLHPALERVPVGVVLFLDLSKIVAQKCYDHVADVLPPTRSIQDRDVISLGHFVDALQSRFLKLDCAAALHVVAFDLERGVE